MPDGSGVGFLPASTAALFNVFLIDGVNAGGIEGRFSVAFDVPGTTEDVSASPTSPTEGSSSLAASGPFGFEGPGNFSGDME